MTAGFLSSAPITSAKWSATCPTVLWAKTSGLALASSTVCGIVGPAGRDGRVAGLLEDPGPAVPAAGQQPQAVDEDDGLQAALVGARDLLALAGGDDLGRVCHGPQP